MAKKPRYDSDKDETRHAAASKKDCEQMEQKYEWKLKKVIDRKDTTLDKDCVFDGYAQFPDSSMDYSQGEDDE